MKLIISLIIVSFVLIFSCAPVPENINASDEFISDDNESSPTFESNLNNIVSNDNDSTNSIRTSSTTTGTSKNGESIKGMSQAYRFTSDTGLIKPSIAVDSKGGVHIIASKGLGNVFIFHIVNRTATSQLLASTQTLSYTGSQIFSRRIVIDAEDRAWINVGFYKSRDYGATGQGIYRIDNIDDSSNILLIARAMYTQNFRFGWFGNIAIDPNHLGQAVLIGFGGLYNRLNTAGQVIQESQLQLQSSGEKIALEISKDGTMHGVMDGWHEASAAYTNSTLNRKVVWAAYSRYPNQGDDLRWPGIGVDNENKKSAYMASGIGGSSNKYLVLNVWNGSRMLFSNTGLYTLGYVSGTGNGADRFPPSFTSAKRSGAYLCWTAHEGNASKIRIKYINYKGQNYFRHSQIVDFGDQCAVTTDANGDLHMVYRVSNGLVYRKLITN